MGWGGGRKQKQENARGPGGGAGEEGGVALLGQWRGARTAARGRPHTRGARATRAAIYRSAMSVAPRTDGSMHLTWTPYRDGNNMSIHLHRCADGHITHAPLLAALVIERTLGAVPTRTVATHPAAPPAISLLRILASSPPMHALAAAHPRRCASGRASTLVRCSFPSRLPLTLDAEALPDARARDCLQAIIVAQNPSYAPRPQRPPLALTLP